MFFTKTSLFAIFATIGLAQVQAQQSFSGQATFYAPGLGSCGVTNSANDLIAALNAPQYNPSVCGRSIRVNYQGKSVVVALEDRCAGCQWGDVDLSPRAFNMLSNPDAGRINVTWSFI